MMLAKKYAKGKARKKLLENLKLKKKVDKIGKKASKKDQKKEAEQAEKDIGRWRKGMEERESRQGAKAGKKKTTKKRYKITKKSFKKKPMTEKQARRATRPQKKYEKDFELEGKKYKMSDSDGSEAARRKGINKLDRADAPRQRSLPEHLPKKKGKTKIIKQKSSNTRWSEDYK